MKKVLMFMALGLFTSSITAALLLYVLQDNKQAGFHSQCLEAKISSPFYRVLEELSKAERVELSEAGSDARKQSCEIIFKQAKIIKKLDLSSLELKM